MIFYTIFLTYLARIAFRNFIKLVFIKQFMVDLLRQNKNPAKIIGGSNYVEKLTEING